MYTEVQPTAEAIPVVSDSQVIDTVLVQNEPSAKEPPLLSEAVKDASLTKDTPLIPEVPREPAEGPQGVSNEHEREALDSAKQLPSEEGATDRLLTRSDALGENKSIESSQQHTGEQASVPLTERTEKPVQERRMSPKQLATKEKKEHEKQLKAIVCLSRLFVSFFTSFVRFFSR